MPKRTHELGFEVDCVALDDAHYKLLTEQEKKALSEILDILSSTVSLYEWGVPARTIEDFDSAITKLQS